MESICCGTPTQGGIMPGQRKDLVMSLMDTFKNKVLMPVTMAATLVTANPFGGNSAKARTPANPDPNPRTEFAANFGDVADGEDPAAKGTDSETKLVPGKDLRGRDYIYVDLGSAKFSKNGVIVLYCGTDPAHFEAIRQGATDAREAGANIKGVVWGDTSPGVESDKEHFSVYAGGAIVVHPDTRMENLQNNVAIQAKWASKTFGKYMANTTKTESPEVATIGNP